LRSTVEHISFYRAELFTVFVKKSTGGLLSSGGATHTVGWGSCPSYRRSRSRIPMEFLGEQELEEASGGDVLMNKRSEEEEARLGPSLVEWTVVVK